MTATTPFLAGEDKLHPLASRYVRTDALALEADADAGIEMKILLQDPESGLLTALFRWAPGTELALHEHVEIEQSFLLEGSLEDDEGEVLEGDFVWRPRGNRHVARSRTGALVLCFFLKPNIFLDGKLEGQELK